MFEKITPEQAGIQSENILKMLRVFKRKKYCMHSIIMAHNENFRMKDYNKIYTDILNITQNDDLTFCNLETPVDNSIPYETYPTFNVQSPYLEAAVNAGTKKGVFSSVVLVSIPRISSFLGGENKEKLVETTKNIYADTMHTLPRKHKYIATYLGVTTSFALESPLISDGSSR